MTTLNLNLRKDKKGMACHSLFCKGENVWQKFMKLAQMNIL